MEEAKHGTLTAKSFGAKCPISVSALESSPNKSGRITPRPDMAVMTNRLTRKEAAVQAGYS